MPTNRQATHSNLWQAKRLTTKAIAANKKPATAGFLFGLDPADAGAY
jgi:hypothetical protein